MDKEVAEIKAEHFEALKSREVILLVQTRHLHLVIVERQ